MPQQNTHTQPIQYKFSHPMGRALHDLSVQYAEITNPQAHFNLRHYKLDKTPYLFKALIELTLLAQQPLHELTSSQFQSLPTANLSKHAKITRKLLIKATKLNESELLNQFLTYPIYKGITNDTKTPTR